MKERRPSGFLPNPIDYISKENVHYFEEPQEGKSGKGATRQREKICEIEIPLGECERNETGPTRRSGSSRTATAAKRNKPEGKWKNTHRTLG